MRSIGIDIGRFSIKVVEILANNRNYQIANAKEYIILNPQSSDQEIDILQTLNQISKEFDTDSAKVICSIRQQYVSTRKLFFPFRERVKIQKSLAFELEDDIPLDVEKAVFDSRIIQYHDNTAEVLAMACILDEVEKTLDIMNRSHIDPDIISPEFSAIANLYERWNKSPEEKQSQKESFDHEGDKMIVHIGHTKTFVGIVSKNHMIWGRSILWGTEKIAAGISQAFQVPVPTAIEMMPEKAFLLLSTTGANKDQIKMSEAVAKSFAPLIQSLRLTMMLAQADYQVNIENVEIIGPASQLKNIGPFFTQELEKPCNSSNPLLTMTEPMIFGVQDLNETFQAALGLAIEGLRRPVNPAVNFRQLHLLKKNQIFQKFWDKWSYSAQLIGVAYVSYLIYGVALDSVTTQMEEVSSEVLLDQASKIAGLKGATATQTRIKGYIKDNNKRAQLVKVYDELSEINSPIQWINDLSQILPSNKEKKNYEVRRLFVKNEEINVQGVADSQTTIDEIQKALKGVALASDVKSIPATISQEDGKKSFAFLFKVKRKN